MKHIFWFCLSSVVIMFTSCGNNGQTSAAEKAKVDSLNQVMSQMHSTIETLQQKQEEEAKTQLDASGIAIVDLGKLFEEYDGYKNAMKRLEGKYKTLLDKAKKDEADFQKRYERFNRNAQVLKEEQVQKQAAELQKEYKEVQNKMMEYEQEYATEQQKLTQEVLEKVNGHLKGYAERNGYQMVLFTPVENNIFYAKDKINITEEYIESLNEAYRKGF